MAVKRGSREASCGSSAVEVRVAVNRMSREAINRGHRGITMPRIKPGTGNGSRPLVRAISMSLKDRVYPLSCGTARV